MPDKTGSYCQIGMMVALIFEYSKPVVWINLGGEHFHFGCTK